MKCHCIMTYFDGSHEEPFYILAEDDNALLHALDVIDKSTEIDYFEVDGEDGRTFHRDVFYRVYPGLTFSAQAVKRGQESAGSARVKIVPTEDLQPVCQGNHYDFDTGKCKYPNDLKDVECSKYINCVFKVGEPVLRLLGQRVNSSKGDAGD